MSTTAITHDFTLRPAGDASERSPDHSDESLLDRFLTGGESDAEAAFREMMFRHGPMVLAVCRQELNGSHDAEDAFQATFLTLARKAATIRNRRLLAGWLCEVAHRIAVRSRGAGARRRAREAEILAMSDSARISEQENNASREEIRPLVQEEVRRLPEKYRTPVILSYFEGKSNEEVAELLNWPVGTVKGRLSRARDMLRSRLKRRGLAFTTAFLLYGLDTKSTSAAPVDSWLMNDALRTSLRPRSTFGVTAESPQTTVRKRANATALSQQAAPTLPVHERISRRLLLYLFVLAIALTVLGFEYHGYFGTIRAADLYELVVDLVRLPLSTGSGCH
jgi:RNA polymerase sigma factor (sigma-70 family)